MKNMTLKNIPDPIHKALKKQAETNHRSLNQEILAILERAASGGPLYRRPDADQVLAEVREMRKLFKRPVTMEEIDRGKREGREDTEKFMAEVRGIRKRFKGSLSMEEIDKAKREGRP